MRLAIINDQRIAENVIEAKAPEGPWADYVPCPEWVGVGDSIDTPMPDGFVSAEAQAEKLRERRRRRYEAEADPLFFKWQRGEGTEEEWLAKVNEIKNDFSRDGQIPVTEFQ